VLREPTPRGQEDTASNIGRGCWSSSPSPGLAISGDALLQMDTLQLSSLPSAAIEAACNTETLSPEAPHIEKAGSVTGSVPLTADVRATSRQTFTSEVMPDSPIPESADKSMRAPLSPPSSLNKSPPSYKPTINNGVGNARKASRSRPLGLSKSIRRKTNPLDDDPGVDGDKEVEKGGDIQMTAASIRKRTRRRRSQPKGVIQDVKMRDRGVVSVAKKLKKRVRPRKAGDSDGMQDGTRTEMGVRRRAKHNRNLDIGRVEIQPMLELPQHVTIALETM